jgi:CelD/BcsL family acetyltransferase involved in cellulose biosynthesis
MLRVISSVQEFEHVRPFWDEIAKTGTNWHLLSHFVRNRMLYYESRGKTPLAILKVIDGNVVGICAFVIQRRYGFKVAQFLLPREYSPDFLVTPEHRESFVEQSLEVLFGRMKCQFVFLTMPKRSLQVVALDRCCATKGLIQTKRVTNKPSVLTVEGEWEDFEKRRGGNFRRRFRRIEGMLTRSGAWTTLQANANTATSVDKIRAVETHSWKHQREKSKKPILAGLNDYVSYQDSPSLPRFAPKVWFLVLNGAPIAYVIVLEINGVAYLAKTSFDDRYHRLSPGEYVLNTAIRSLFDSGRVCRIDFMTGLPFMKRWTSLREPIETIRISQGGPIFALWDFFRGRLPQRVLKFSQDTLRISLEPV